MRLPLTNPDDMTAIDIEQMKKMVDEFIGKGFTYFDTAYPYHNGMSEVAFRKAVSERYPRQAYTVTDKMPCWEIETEADLERIFNVQLERCGVSYFDYYWLHALNRDYYKTMERVHGFDFIARKKAEGKIRHIGFSFHDDLALLQQILDEHPEAEYVQLQINYLDWEDASIDSRRCYEACVAHHKPVIVMEPVKGGSLAKVPAEVEEMFKEVHPEMSPASWAVRYAASLDNVMMVLSGMSNLEQMEDNTSYMENFEPIDDKEQEIIQTATGIIRHSIAIPCTACHYCTEGCPQQISIPEYFALYNTLHLFGRKQQWMNTSINYGVLNQTHGKASDCIECGQCEEHCPQHIQIIDNLKKVAQTFES